MSNTFKFSSRSEKNLQGVNPDLVKVTRRGQSLRAAWSTPSFAWPARCAITFCQCCCAGVIIFSLRYRRA